VHLHSANANRIKHSLITRWRAFSRHGNELPRPPGPQARGQAQGFTEAGYARLPGAGHQQLGGPLVLVWDNLNTHVSGAMSELVAARGWLTVFQLPAYASELNPVESVWSHLKRSLANLAKRDIAQLTALVKTRLRRMQYQPGLIEGFLAGTRLDLTPFCNLLT
jgi:putative transposase